MSEEQIKDSDIPRDRDEIADDYNERGISFFNLKKYPEAIKEFTKAIKILNNDPDYYFNRGLSYYSMRMYESAVKDYEKAIDILPGNADYHNALGAALEDSGKISEAEAEFSRAIDLESDIPDFFYNRGLSYYSMRVFMAKSIAFT